MRDCLYLLPSQSVIIMKFFPGRKQGFQNLLLDSMAELKIMLDLPNCILDFS